MILEEDLIVAGQITKTHGIKGELSILTHFDIFEIEIPFIVFEMDGIFVPFFIDELRIKSALSGYIKLENIDSDKKSQEFVGKNVYVSKKFVENIDDEDVASEYFIGFEIEDENTGNIGTIIAIEDSTANILFAIHAQNGEEILIPIADEYIKEILHSEKIIVMNLPVGLIDM